MQGVELPHVDSPNANHFGTWSRRGDILGHPLSFLDISPNYARVGAEVDESADLRAADGSGAAGTEDDLVVWGGNTKSDQPVIMERKRNKAGEGNCTEKAVLPDVAEIVGLWDRHGGGNTEQVA